MNIRFKITSGLAITLLAIATASSSLPAPVLAQQVVDCGCENDCQGSCRLNLVRRHIGRKACCPSCNEFCELKTEVTKEKQTCYKVEEKTICIPAVRLPWQKCAPPQHSETRKINVLKKESYECPKCKYSWEVVKPEVAEPQMINEPAAPAIEPPGSVSAEQQYLRGLQSRQRSGEITQQPGSSGTTAPPASFFKQSALLQSLFKQN